MIASTNSWDFDGAPPEVVFVGSQQAPPLSSDRSVMSEMMPSSRSSGMMPLSSYCPSDRSVLTEAPFYKPNTTSLEGDDNDDDMPMDEMQDTIQVMKGKASEMELLRLEAAASKKEIERLHQILQHQGPSDHPTVPLTVAQIDAADQGGGVGRGMPQHHHHQQQQQQQLRSLTRGGIAVKEDDDDDVSSLGDAHDVLDDQQALHSSPSPPPPPPVTAVNNKLTETPTAAQLPPPADIQSVTSASLVRLTQAIQTSTRPSDMSLAEQELWNAIQSSLRSVRTEYANRHRVLERQLQESSSQNDHIQLEQSSTQKQYQQALNRIDALEQELKQQTTTKAPSNTSAEVQRLQEKLQQVQQQYQEANQLATTQQNEHDRELRAIQRVLADISTQKDMEIEKMETKLKALQAEKDALQQQLAEPPKIPATAITNKTRELELSSSSTPSIPKDAEPQKQIEMLQQKIEELSNSLQEALAERDAAHQELERKSVKNATLERELRAAKVHQAKVVEQQRKKEDDNTKNATVAAADAAVLDKLKKELEAANVQVKKLQARLKNDDNVDDLRTLLQETVAARDAAQQELERKITKLTNLERELRAVKAKATVANTKSTTAADNKALEQAKTDLAAAHKEIEQLKIREKDLSADVEAKGKQIRTLRRQINTVRNSKDGSNNTAAGAVAATVETTNKADTVALEEELAKVRKELQEKESSLENAKMIIASLENANGSLAIDLRAKLRTKDDELLAMQTEAADRKRTIDSLALELRDLQGKSVKFDPNLEPRSRKQIEKHRELADKLEKSLSELQSALVVHEAATESVGTADDPVVQQINDILCQSLAIVKASLDVYDLPDETMELESTFSSYVGTDLTLASELNRQVDALIRDDREAAAKELRHELESKTATLKRLEESMKSQSEEITKLRQDYDKLRGEKEAEEERLYVEMRNLRDQCMTNMEVLTKKERELEVLRDSLKVDDGVGYISDDGSDDGDEGQNPNHVPSPPRISSSLQYGPSQAEALATLLVHGGGASVSKVTDSSNSSVCNNGTSSAEVEKLKSDLAKAQVDLERMSRELRAERESLANAKMIISSLEKANKSMMEDLRKRLQDSTTAIAALVDKSMENEKVSNELRKEMEQVKREREDERVKYKVDLKKFKDELLVANLRIAAKDKELDEFRRNKEPQRFVFGSPISTDTTGTSEGGQDVATIVTPTSSTADVNPTSSVDSVEASPSQQAYHPTSNDDNEDDDDAELAALTETIDGIPASQEESNDDDNVFNYNHDSNQLSQLEPVS